MLTQVIMLYSIIFIRCQEVLFQVQQAKAGLMNAPLIEILKQVITVDVRT